MPETHLFVSRQDILPLPAKITKLLGDIVVVHRRAASVGLVIQETVIAGTGVSACLHRAAVLVLGLGTGPNRGALHCSP